MKSVIKHTLIILLLSYISPIWASGCDASTPCMLTVENHTPFIIKQTTDPTWTITVPPSGSIGVGKKFEPMPDDEDECNNYKPAYTLQFHFIALNGEDQGICRVTFWMGCYWTREYSGGKSTFYIGWPGHGTYTINCGPRLANVAHTYSLVDKIESFESGTYYSGLKLNFISQ